MMDIKDIAHGAVGLSKVALGIEKVSDEVSKKRLEICLSCPNKIKQFSKLVNKDVSKCSICKCFIKAKVLLKNEFCPDNPPRWEKEP